MQREPDLQSCEGAGQCLASGQALAGQSGMPKAPGLWAGRHAATGLKLPELRSDRHRSLKQRDGTRREAQRRRRTCRGRLGKSWCPAGGWTPPHPRRRRRAPPPSVARAPPRQRPRQPCPLRQQWQSRRRSRLPPPLPPALLPAPRGLPPLRCPHAFETGLPLLASQAWPPQRWPDRQGSEGGVAARGASVG